MEKTTEYKKYLEDRLNKKTSLRKIKDMLLKAKDNHYLEYDLAKENGVIKSKDEMRYIIDAFNAMADALSVVNYIKKTRSGKDRDVYISDLYYKFEEVIDDTMPPSEKVMFFSQLKDFLDIDVMMFENPDIYADFIGGK